MYKFSEHIIKFIDKYEICQGGPEAGRLIIDGKQINGYYFHEPPLIIGKYLLVPALFRSWMSTGFKIAIVDLSNYSVKLSGPKFNYIRLKKVEGNRVLFYTNVSETEEASLILNL